MSKQRPRYLHQRVVRLLTRECVANAIGPDACWLITVVVTQQLVIDFKRPVTYSNEQLMPLCGFGSRKRLVTARRKAVEAGWLSLHPGQQVRGRAV